MKIVILLLYSRVWLGENADFHGFHEFFDTLIEGVWTSGMLVYILPFLETAAFPPGILILLAVAALLCFAFRRRNTALWIAVGDVVLLYLLSIVPVANLLVEPLEQWYPPFSPSAAAGLHPGYVVVLGGGLVPRSPEAGGAPTLAPESLKRLVYGVEIARSEKLPIIVSGGIVPSAPASEPEAAVAAATIRQMGIPVPRVLQEDASRNTWENALYVERDYHPKLVILVTSAFHMPRSIIAFRRHGIRVIPAPTDYLSRRGRFVIYDLLPEAGSLQVSAVAIKEYVGILDYLLRR